MLVSELTKDQPKKGEKVKKEKEERVLIIADCVAQVIISKGSFVFEPERKNIWLILPEGANGSEKRKEIIRFCKKLQKQYSPRPSVVVRIGNSAYDFEKGKLKGWDFGNEGKFVGFVDDPRTQCKLRNGGYNEVIDL